MANIERIAGDKRPMETEEEGKVKKFVEVSCGCKLGHDGTPCSSLFTESEILDLRIQMHELEHGERDMLVNGFLLSSRPRPNSEKLTTLRLFGKRVCRATFLFMLDISKKLYTTIASHFVRNGVSTRRHGNTNRLPSNTPSKEASEHIKKFVGNFAEVHGVCLPGRDPHRRDEKNVLIASNLSKSSIYNFYKESCSKAGIKCAGYSLFCDR